MSVQIVIIVILLVVGLLVWRTAARFLKEALEGEAAVVAP